MHIWLNDNGTDAYTALWHTSLLSAPDPKNKAQNDDSKPDSDTNQTGTDAEERPKEIGGRGGLDPTRYGDWEKAGRCIDF